MEASIAELPKEAALSWLKHLSDTYLDEIENLPVGHYVGIRQLKLEEGKYRELAIYRSGRGYHLIYKP